MELLRKKRGRLHGDAAGGELPEYKAELDPYCPRAGAEV